MAKPRLRTKRNFSVLLLLMISLVWALCGSPGSASTPTARERTAPTASWASEVAARGPNISDWIEVRQGDFSALLPGSAWSLEASQNGADVIDRQALATVSFGYATGGPTDYTYNGVLELVVQSFDLNHIHVLRESSPLEEPDGERRIFQFTGRRDGVSADVVAAVDLYANNFSIRLELGAAKHWRQLQPTMDQIVQHLTFYGEEPPEVAPGHCGLDPSSLPNKYGNCYGNSACSSPWTALCLPGNTEETRRLRHGLIEH